MRERPLFEWDWIPGHLDIIWERFLEHVLLTTIAVGIGFAISLPLGILIHRKPKLFPPVTGTAGVLYTVPSLALFALLVPWTGLSTLTAEIGLVSYTLFILIRNVRAALDGVPEDVKEAARGMGYTSGQMLLRVELPLATPGIVAGIRIATVTTIGLVTVTTIIGKGGFGHIFFRLGYQRFDNTPMIVGALLAVGLAVAAEAVLLLTQRALTPWARRHGDSGRA
jgi:osmoprotectant transport system permease protein